MAQDPFKQFLAEVTPQGWIDPPFNPMPGDLIEINRGVYKHWAMYSDIPGYVFHISSKNKNADTGVVRHERLEDVVEKCSKRLNNLETNAKIKGLKARPAKEAIRAAREQLNQTVHYDTVTRNCEFYCTQWKYETGFTNQIYGTVGAASGALFGPVGAIIGYGVGNVVGFFSHGIPSSKR